MSLSVICTTTSKIEYIFNLFVNVTVNLADGYLGSSFVDPSNNKCKMMLVAFLFS